MTSLLFSPDENYLAAGGSNSPLRIWRIGDFKPEIAVNYIPGWAKDWIKLENLQPAPQWNIRRDVHGSIIMVGLEQNPRQTIKGLFGIYTDDAGNYHDYISPLPLWNNVLYLDNSDQPKDNLMQQPIIKAFQLINKLKMSK